MRATLAAGYALIVAGVVLYFVMAFLGLAHFALFVVFPVVYSTQAIALIPFALIFLGIVLLMLTPFVYMRRPVEFEPYGFEDQLGQEAQEEGERERKSSFGGLVMIGPVPIIFSNDRKITYAMIALAIILIAVFLFLYFR
ncbi:hypothetical protein GCM10007108_03620 [Thermogymnomonas acidicola]|uniref:DUF131 domain-containing protein n=1 Tax=Thermogymnomonas acidicola TaxID=399579 RepID=A0AA37BQ85_9ARCH|nr:DUF131 domain-containing protein [Thermogymnomonas acidicola]GGM68761.1 hypothetical protein GCM10007108_03620 [Thermogymnomonas acidicola]